MSIVRVALGPRGYDVIIEDGLIDRAAQSLSLATRGGQLVVVSDEEVWAAQGERLCAGLGPIDVKPVLVPSGEASKSWPELADLVDRLCAAGVERSDVIVAFGGGMVGDLAGFASAILMRGCGLVQIPTSLLAQVDSSVGGKTGINIAAGKNLVGAFHQPSMVLIDPRCLDTLPARHVRAGYAEILKYALIADHGFFDWLETHGASVIAGVPEPLSRAIEVAVAGKARIVEADERETSGRRALLNLGHTFGHALEAEAGFSHELLHGEAVAVGIALAFRFAAERGLCSLEAAERVVMHLRRLALPTTLAEAGIDADGKRITERMLRDKKVRHGRLRLVLPRGIGDAFLDNAVEFDEVVRFLDRQRAVAVT